MSSEMPPVAIAKSHLACRKAPHPRAGAEVPPELPRPHTAWADYLSETVSAMLSGKAVRSGRWTLILILFEAKPPDSSAEAARGSI